MTTVKATTLRTPSAARGLSCVRCDTTYPLESYFEGCPACARDSRASNLVVTYDHDQARRTFSPETIARRDRAAGVWRWAELLPIHPEGSRLSMAEGSTPLLPWTGDGTGSVLLKDESRNPTWSFKDRFCAVALSHAHSQGSSVCGVASSGNHGAAAAAYAAIAQMDCVVFARASIPQSMKSLILGLGAILFATPNEGDHRWELLRAAVSEAGWYPASNYTRPPTGNPYGQEGYKTIAFELWEQLGWQVPGSVVVPTGYGEGLSGIWSGFSDLAELGYADRLPQMVAVETATAGPLFAALESGADVVTEVGTSPSVAFSINTPTSSLRALQAIRASDGFSMRVTDAEILAAQAELGRGGFLVEASSASAVAALKRIGDRGISLPQPVVALLTSSGMKDLGQVSHQAEPRMIDGGWAQLGPMLRHVGRLGDGLEPTP